MRRARCRSSPCASSCNRVGRSGALRHRACRRGGPRTTGVAGGLGPALPDSAGRGLARLDVSGGDEPERRAVRAVGVTVSRRRRKWPENVAPRRAWSVPSPFESRHGRLMSIGREHAAARSRERIGGMVGKRRSVIRVSPSPGREGPGRRRSVRHPPRAFAREPPGQDGARRRPSRRAPPRGAPARGGCRALYRWRARHSPKAFLPGVSGAGGPAGPTVRAPAALATRAGRRRSSGCAT